MYLREKIIEYVKEKYNSEPEYLWNRFPEYAVFRHSAQNLLDNRQVNDARFAHSDEKIDGASAALYLCGITLNKEFDIV